MSQPQPDANAPEPRAGSGALKVVFFTLFIDLVGFSIIFPLFPSMLEYYQHVEGDAGLFGLLLEGLRRFAEMSGTPTGHWGEIVLFGGVLGSLYSLLQFVCAPFFGALSDRIGRRPVLLLSLTGILMSYALWFVAGSFIVLVLARLIGGVMSANISTATAVVADVTTEKTRSKGMALVGIAFGVGFIIGPAIGAIAAQVDLVAWRPGLATWGVNPYSFVAAIAFGLTLLNLVLVATRFPETRRADHPSTAAARTLHPLKLLRTVQYPGVTRANLVYFLFTVAFAGMEFSLTFLAVDRLGYSTLDNAKLFLFAGIVQILVQGGYVRRMAAKVGSRRMALHGMVVLAPGFVLIGAGGQFQSVVVFYAGLFLLSLGGAQATPCLTALVSLYTPHHDQGRVMGIFRSLGALARAIGPIAACLAYWRLGGAWAYYLCGGFALLPLWLVIALPEKEKAAAPAAAA